MEDKNSMDNRENRKSREKAIELKNVAVHYTESKSLFKREKYQALKDISFDVYKGETLGIIGRNGAGKSTLLRLLAGIIKPDKGEVIHHCKSVSLMALAAGFDPNLSGRQNAVISGMLIGHSKKEMLSKLEEIKEFAELGDFFEKPVKTYSSGMRARLGFATAMHTHPDVLLIDEVLAVGDANFKQKAEKAITDKIQSDITVILVSHSEQQMKRLCERVVWVESGKVVKSGSDLDNIFQLYRMNMKFSRSGIFIENFEKLDPNVEFCFESLEFKQDKLVFNCFFCYKIDCEITNVKVNPANVVLSGPFASPIVGSRYKKYQIAYKSRFHCGVCIINKENFISAYINNVESIVLKFKIVKNREGYE